VAAATIAARFVLSMAAFGTEIWYAFAASTETSRNLLLQNGGVGFKKLQSVIAVVRCSVRCGIARDRRSRLLRVAQA
jgi:hypothetical protein